MTIQDHGVGLLAFTLSHAWLHISYARLLWLRQAYMIAFSITILHADTAG